MAGCTQSEVIVMTRAQLIANLMAVSDDPDQAERLEVTFADLRTMRQAVANGNQLLDVMLAWETGELQTP